MQAPLLPFLQKKHGHTPKHPLVAPNEKMVRIASATIFFLLQEHTEVQNTGTATSLQVLAPFDSFPLRLHKGCDGGCDRKSSF